MTDEQLPLTPIGRKVVEPSHRLPADQWAKVVAEAAEIRRQQAEDAAMEPPEDDSDEIHLGARLLAPAPRKVTLPAVVNLTAAGRNSGKYFPVSGIPTQLIVFHSMECPLQAGYARSLTNWALTPESAGGPQASWHRGYGPDERVYFIPDELGAWHASEANPLSIGLEQTGYAAYTRAQWLTADGLRMLDGVAADVAAICKRDGIPAKWLTTAEVRAVLDGGNRSIKGFCFHRQVDPETRTDPGNGYPADVTLSKVQALLKTPAPSTEGSIVGATEVQQIKQHINAVLLGPYRWDDGLHPDGIRGDVEALVKKYGWAYKGTGVSNDAYSALRNAEALGRSNADLIKALQKTVTDQGAVLASQQKLLANLSQQLGTAVTLLQQQASPPVTPPAS